MNDDTPQPRPAQDSAESQPDSRRGALIGLGVILLLVLAGMFLNHVLRQSAQLQDCVMEGRTNCAPVDGASGDR